MEPVKGGGEAPRKLCKRGGHVALAPRGAGTRVPERGLATSENTTSSSRADRPKPSAFVFHATGALARLSVIDRCIDRRLDRHATSRQKSGFLC